MRRFWLTCLLTTTLVALSQSSEDEFRLYEYLLKGYDPRERPVLNSSFPLVVKIRVFLQQIIDVDEKNQVIQVNAWLRYIWHDYKLNWDPNEFGNITDVRFPGEAGQIWRPDILLYNSADQNFDSTYPSNFIAYSNGEVNWIPPGILKSSCKIDITWFPFDDQDCYLKFGSWTYNGWAVDLQVDADDMNGTHQMDLSEYVVNGEWILMATPARRVESFYKCCPEPYPSVYFHMHIRRRTLYYGFNLIIPSLLISLMTVLGFTLPPDAGEKITLEITILLSVCFFLSIVADMTPPTSEAVPLIGTFFSCCMLVVSASVVFTVVVLNLHFRSPDTHEMSPFVRIVLLKWLPWLLMMRRPGQKFSRKAFLAADSDKESNQSAPATMMTPVPTPFSQSTESESLMRNVRPLEVGLNIPFADDQLEHHKNCCVSNNHVAAPRAPPLGQLGIANGDSRTSIDFEARIHSAIAQLSIPDNGDPAVHAQLLMLHRVYTELKFITRRMEQEDEDEDAQNDWKFAAMVVDRLCLIVFSAFIVASTCGIMFSAPHLNA